MNQVPLEISNYRITTDSSFSDKKYKVTPEIRQILQEIYPKVKKGKSGTIKKLKKYCHRYPHIPQFKNYLEAAYEAAGLHEKMLALNRQVRKEHPDYLFGKITYASILIQNGEPEKVPDILGGNMNLNDLYPDRENFHLREVLGFFKVCVEYCLAADKQENILPYITAMHKIGPDEPETEFVQTLWVKHTMEGVAQRLEKENERRRSVENLGYDKSIQTNEKPVFNHPEIKALYSHDIRIDHQIIRDILKLPQQSLIEDLEEVVEDSIRRFEYFRELSNQYNEWNNKEFSFILHALFLLAELKASESLPAVLRLLRQGEELLHFWFSDSLTEMVPEVFYHLVQNGQLDDLQDFMKEPDNYAYARNVVQTAVAQIALHQPERREEVIEWFGDLFQYFLSNPTNERVLDTDLISFMVGSAIDLCAVELEEIIRDFYEHDLHFVEEGIIGNLDSVLTDMKSKHYRSEEYDVYDIYSRYNHLIKIWYPEQKQEVSTFETALRGNVNKKGNERSHNQPFQSPGKEVGRNDPCPCGSGKKYKYCCMR